MKNNDKATTQVWVSPKTRDQLHELKKGKMTINDVINKLIDYYYDKGGE